MTEPVVETPYSLDDWLCIFDTADNKSAIAVQWLDAFLTSTRRRGAYIEADLYQAMKRRMRDVRRMAMAIPAGHEVLTKAHQKRDTQVTAWLRRYFDVSTPLPLGRKMTQWGLCDAQLVRDMWLQPSMEDRKNALWLLLVEKQKSANPDFLDVILNAAWDIAGQSNDSELLQKALALTLRACDTDVRYQFTQPTSGYPLLDAIRSVYATVVDSPSMLALRPTDITKGLSAYPSLCVQVLKETDRATLNVEMYSQDRFDSLSTWFPEMAALVAASQAMGLSYEEALHQLEKAVADSLAIFENTSPLDGVTFG